MAGNKQIPKLKNMAFNALKTHQSAYLKENGFFSPDIFSISSDDPHQITEAIDIVTRVTFTLFLQAVIDEDGEMVQKCLEAEPKLLLEKPNNKLVIESKLTWQKFYAEGALMMAAKRKQIKMIELLIPYYDQLEQTEQVIKAKTDAVSTLEAYKMQKSDDEIVIPREYIDYAESLIKVFIEERCLNGVTGKLSEKTEDALKSLFNILLPRKAVKLDDYLDPELFLLALYQAYRDQFNSFQTWDQRDAFCIRVIGLAQSVLPPEAAKIFCEGFFDFTKNKKISERAKSLTLRDGKSFYRVSRQSRSGLGFNYFILPYSGMAAGPSEKRFHIRCQPPGIARLELQSLRLAHISLLASPLQTLPDQPPCPMVLVGD